MGYRQLSENSTIRPTVKVDQSGSRTLPLLGSARSPAHFACPVNLNSWRALLQSRATQASKQAAGDSCESPLLSCAVFPDLQHCEESLLRYIDLADSLHALLALLLFLEELALAANVASVALRDDVFAQG